jgi:hypothetical protein
MHPLVTFCCHREKPQLFVILILLFSSDKGVTQEQHLQRMLSGIAVWISPPESVILAVKTGKSER